MSETIKITYIGGGSSHWARVIMQDLALTAGKRGVVLYDINHQRALANMELAEYIFNHPDALSSYATSANQNLAQALQGRTLFFFPFYQVDLFCQRLKYSGKLWRGANRWGYRWTRRSLTLQHARFRLCGFPAPSLNIAQMPGS